MNKERKSIKTILSAELSQELSPVWNDSGIRSGIDSIHPLHRSEVVTSFVSPNVLGLFEHRNIFQAVVSALRNNCGELGASRIDGAHSALHESCEDRVASFFGGDTSLIFNSKNQAILTLITALATTGLTVIGPAFTPLPLADACALVEAPYEEYSSLEDLKEILNKNRSLNRRLVFGESMGLITGGELDVPAFFSILETFDAWGIVDESAFIAYSGLRGAGSSELVPTHPNLIARISSAVPLMGIGIAAMSMSVELREILLRRSRYLQCESPPNPAEVSGLRAAIDTIEMAVSGRQQLAARALHVFEALEKQGWRIVSARGNPCISIWQESIQSGLEIKSALLKRKHLVEVIPAKALLSSGCVVRVRPSILHSEVEISNLLESFSTVRARRPRH